jgi:hypothetical protein
MAGLCIRWFFGLGVVLLLAWSAESSNPLDPAQRLAEAEANLSGADSERERFYVLATAAKLSFEVQMNEEAETYALELLDLAQSLERDWNYGNAIHDGNMVMGRLALVHGDAEEAKRRLLEAGKTPGSPQLNSFGPNMSLAQDLLAVDEREAVIEYLTQCLEFWELGREKLEDWIALVEGGRRPDFGANLLY